MDHGFPLVDPKTRWEGEALSRDVEFCHAIATACVVVPGVESKPHRRKGFRPDGAACKSDVSPLPGLRQARGGVPRADARGYDVPPLSGLNFQSAMFYRDAVTKLRVAFD